ncbi:MAG: tetratricopeptide repeat protein [Candidatus Acidiferrales bacterium]
MPIGRLKTDLHTLASWFRNTKNCRRAAVLACVFAAVLPSAQAARQSFQSSSSSKSAKPDQATSGSSVDSPGQQPAQYDPREAEKDVEVATFYMRKGDPDASIPRLEDAIRLRPNYAKPRLMLAEIYEKKEDKENAVKYYREYLQVYPHAPDAKKVEKKIAKLSEP